MDILDKIYFDNTVRSYLYVGIIILVTVIIKRYISRYIASLFHQAIQHNWPSIDRKSFVDLIATPLKWFLFIIISIIVIDKLNFPQVLKYTIYGANTQSIIRKIGTGIIIVSFFRLLLCFVDFIAMILERKAQLTDDKADDQMVVFFRDFLKVIIGIIGLLILIKFCFGQSIGNIFTGLSLMGAAIALAARESLENLIASFIIFIDKPFFTGDSVKVQNISGTIEKIGLRSTRIRTSEKTLVSVPNKQMVDSIVDNQSMRTKRRAEIRTDLDPKTKAAVVENILTEIKKIFETKDQAILSHTVYLKEISKAGLTIVVEYFTTPVTIIEFDTLKQEMNFSVKKILENNDANMADTNPAINIITENKSKEN